MAMSTPFFGRWLVCFKKAVVLRFGRLVAHRAHLKNRKFMQRLENNFESTLKHLHHPLRRYWTGSWWRLLLRDEGIVRLIFSVGLGI